MSKPPDWPIARRLAELCHCAYATACSAVRVKLAVLQAGGMNEAEAFAAMDSMKPEDFRLRPVPPPKKLTLKQAKRRRLKRNQKRRRFIAREEAIAQGKAKRPGPKPHKNKIKLIMRLLAEHESEVKRGHP